MTKEASGPIRPEATATVELVALVEPHEVSQYLGVPLGTLANWRYQRRGPAFVRYGRLVRYRAEDITAWLQANLALTGDVGAPNRASTRRRS